MMRTGVCRRRPRVRGRRAPAALLVLALCALTGAAPGATAAPQDDKDKKEKRASLSLKASPPIAFAPARVVVTAELRGGSGDTEELYCPAVEWEWGDGTTSEANADCEPFEAGRSEIRRRWTASHTFNQGGNYRVELRLKRNGKSVVSGSVNVQIRAGFREPQFY